jgi:hypothetical protein
VEIILRAWKKAVRTNSYKSLENLFTKGPHYSHAMSTCCSHRIFVRTSEFAERISTI